MAHSLLGALSSVDTSLDIPHPTTTLTKRQCTIVQQTWNNVCKIGISNLGVELFYLYFTRHPENQKLFKSLCDIPLNQLKGHPRMRAHGTIVAQTLCGMIDNLQEPGKLCLRFGSDWNVTVQVETETIVLLLQKIGRDHARRNIKVERFEELQQTILALLERTLGKAAFTPIVRESWTEALTVVMKVITQALQEEEDAAVTKYY